MTQKVVSSVDVGYVDVAVVSAGSGDAGKVVGLDGNGKVDVSVLPFAIPTGGTTGQILAKKSDLDYDLQWISLPSGVPTGAVEYFAMATAPTGWLAADGSAVSRTTYADLFAAIGTTFGAGDGSTTFNLPDLRGEFVRGYDNGRGVDSGRVFGSAQNDAMQEFKVAMSVISTGEVSPNHTNVTSTAMCNGSDITVYIPVGPAGSYEFRPFARDNSNTIRQAAETRPRNVALLACVKY